MQPLKTSTEAEYTTVEGIYSNDLQVSYTNN